jgi:hypothetical protein
MSKLNYSEKKKLQSLVNAHKPWEIWTGWVPDPNLQGREVRIAITFWIVRESRGAASGYEPVWGAYSYGVDSDGNEVLRHWTSKKNFEKEYTTRFLPSYRKSGLIQVQDKDSPKYAPFYITEWLRITGRR